MGIAGIKHRFVSRLCNWKGRATDAGAHPSPALKNERGRSSNVAWRGAAAAARYLDAIANLDHAAAPEYTDATGNNAGGQADYHQYPLAHSYQYAGDA